MLPSFPVLNRLAPSQVLVLPAQLEMPLKINLKSAAAAKVKDHPKRRPLIWFRDINIDVAKDTEGFGFNWGFGTGDNMGGVGVREARVSWHVVGGSAEDGWGVARACVCAGGG